MLLNLPLRLFSKISVFAIIKKSIIHSTASIQSGTRFYNSRIEDYSYISRDCVIVNTIIGKFCSIADNVIINAGKHPLNFVSSSPVFYSKNNCLKKCFNEISYNEYDSTIIGNDVWIGTHAFIKGGISIGDGAVIGAYTIVTKDVEPYTVIVGNPGRVLKKRFDDDLIKKLLKLKWWSFNEDLLRKCSSKMNNVNEFIDFCEIIKK